MKKFAAVVIAIAALVAAVLVAVNRPLEGMWFNGQGTSIVVVALLFVAFGIPTRMAIKRSDQIVNGNRIARSRKTSRANRHSRSIRNGRQPIPYH